MKSIMVSATHGPTFSACDPISDLTSGRLEHRKDQNSSFNRLIYLCVYFSQDVKKRLMLLFSLNKSCDLLLWLVFEVLVVFCLKKTEVQDILYPRFVLFPIPEWRFSYLVVLQNLTIFSHLESDFLASRFGCFHVLLTSFV